MKKRITTKADYWHAAANAGIVEHWRAFHITRCPHEFAALPNTRWGAAGPIPTGRHPSAKKESDGLRKTSACTDKHLAVQHPFVPLPSTVLATGDPQPL